MSIRDYFPNKRNTNQRRFYDQLAQPFLFEGSEAGVLLLHGFTGTPANMRIVADALAHAGYSVYVPLLSGHGTSIRDLGAHTQEDWLSDALSAYDTLCKAGAKRVYAVGLSMGALLATIIAAQQPCAGLVLISAPFQVKPYLNLARHISGIMPYVMTHGEGRYQYDSYAQGNNGVPLRKLKDIDKLALMARSKLGDITCPTLILQPKDDNRVDMKSVMIAQNGVKSDDVAHIMLLNSPHGCTFGPERELVAEHCLHFVQRLEEKNALIGEEEHDG